MNVKQKLFNKIKKTNYSIGVDEFINICLYDQDGYYNKNYPIGKKGDFITSPEISQLFGEILGLYIYDFWNKNLQCKFNLIEIGPGKGTLLNDIFRINKNFKLFINSIHLNLIEINIELIKLQRKNFSNLAINFNKIRWSKNIDSIETLDN